MDKQIPAINEPQSSQSDISNIKKRAKAAIGLMVMFFACLLVCHSPKLIHEAFSYFSR
ncbi:hypothetical protein [Acaryochloris sp. CCMEE 5410]|uniref:hypothetical protein n=1 Tax=Acaryochloris sp. CCMEE 5410 TaxID=310037 RepID=UPI000319F3E4|nr:hypothetical protein [Acaryochloris sp. CCMEE 5410]KAI9129925.1 hypothetical protein ON05_030120 [Acaryochloris sp. CCMEE 5410]